MNVLCLGARVIGEELAADLVGDFLGAILGRRASSTAVEKIAALERAASEAKADLCYWLAQRTAIALHIEGRRRRPYLSAVRVEPTAKLGKTVLLVEDNEDNRIIYSTVLRHVGYDVVEAEDGLQAVALARSALPDLILMDISIPGMDGWEATRILRRDPATRTSRSSRSPRTRSPTTANVRCRWASRRISPSRSNRGRWSPK